MCLFCKMANRVLKNCRKFRVDTPNGRRLFIVKQEPCFGCLNHGHLSRDCPENSTCDACQGKHPTCLHGNFEALNSSSNASPMEMTAFATPSNARYKFL